MRRRGRVDDGVEVHFVQLDVGLRGGHVEERAADGGERDGRVRELPFAGGVGTYGRAEHAAQDLVPEADA